MPVHDWTRVDAGIFHSFHNGWITHLAEWLNGGLLPAGYYALGEQHAGRFVTDVLTLHTSRPNGEPPPPPPEPVGGLALAEAPPKVRRQLTGTETYRQRRRTLAIRHVSGHRLIAVVEIASPANKDRLESVEEFVTKGAETLEFGIHVLLIDLLPPGRHDPRGLHAAVWGQFDEAPYDLPVAEPLTLAAYTAGAPVKAYMEHLAIGGLLPEMPLFLRSDRYIPVPLEATYQAAYRGVPAFWQDVLEGRAAPAP
ncbi:MAG TPA: DUF4058 family protein [Gemmataceae bacterium]|nr:DUF4058 family protein [Gemmataceae bacterium]